MYSKILSFYKSKDIIDMLPSGLLILSFLGISINLIVSCEHHMLLIYIALFSLISVLLSIKKFSLKVKYSLLVLIFIVFFISVKIIYPCFNELSIICFFIPAVYAYLLPNPLTPFFVGCFIVILLKGYNVVVDSRLIINNMIGIIFASIAYSVIFSLIRNLKSEMKRVKSLYNIDPLTKLANLNYLINKGEEMVSTSSSITVYVFDIDYFKKFNDTYGHLIGNSILVQIADILKETTKNLNSIVGRSGGDEYIILAKDLSYKESEKLYSRFYYNLQQNSYRGDPDLDPIKVSCSLGMAYVDNYQNLRLQDIIRMADLNMYYNKQVAKVSIDCDHDFKVILGKDFKVLLDILAEKDMYSYVHSQYVVKYSSYIAKELNLPEKIIEEICIAAWMHDIGKILIPNHILRKPGKLTDEEYDLMKSHVKRGINILSEFRLSNTIINAIKYHHERYDGNGYPYKISGDDIPIEAKILQIADSFSAMTIKRVYRKLAKADEALEEIERNIGKQFDPDIAKLFIEVMKCK